MVYGVNYNKDHIFKYHLFKPRAVLLNEAFFSHKAPKSVFLKEFSENFILDLVTKTLLDPNICVERQDYWTVLIRKRYAIMPNFLILIVIYINKFFDEFKKKTVIVKFDI